MEKFKNVIIGILSITIIFLWLWKGCEHKHMCTPDLIQHVDTTIIMPKDTVVEHHWHDPKPVDSTYTPIDTVGVNIDSLCLAMLNTLNYIRYYKDSVDNEDISIWVEDSVRGTLLYKALTYKLKIPKEIHINTTNYVYPTWDLYGGGFLSKEGDKFNFGPMLGLRFKNLYLSYSKGITVPSNLVTVGLRFQVNKRKVKKNLFF